MTYSLTWVEPIPRMVSTVGNWSPTTTSTNGLATSLGATASTQYDPIYVPVALTVQRFWFTSGATASGGATIQIGLYSSEGSGYAGARPYVRWALESATMTNTANNIQFMTLGTPLHITPGWWWVSVTSSTTTNTTMWGINYNVNGRVMSMTQATTSPPAQATPVRQSSGQTLYVAGFSTVTTP